MYNTKNGNGLKVLVKDNNPGLMTANSLNVKLGIYK